MIPRNAVLYPVPVQQKQSPKKDFNFSLYLSSSANTEQNICFVSQFILFIFDEILKNMKFINFIFDVLSLQFVCLHNNCAVVQLVAEVRVSKYT